MQKKSRYISYSFNSWCSR